MNKVSSVVDFYRADTIVLKLEQFTENNFLSQEMPVAGAMKTKMPGLLEERFFYIEEQVSGSSL